MPNENDLFLTTNDVNLKLAGCIVSYKNKWWNVVDSFLKEEAIFERVVYARLHPINGGKRIDVPANSPEIVFALSHLLGWSPANIPTDTREGLETSRFYYRTPIRRNKLGLSFQNIDFLYANITGCASTPANQQEINRQFILMLEKEGYPSLPTLVNDVAPKFISEKAQEFGFVALTPSFAVHLSRSSVKGKTKVPLWHLSYQVGFFDLSTAVVELTPEHAHSVFINKILKDLQYVRDVKNTEQL